MCKICVDYDLGLLKIDEAYSNLKETFKEEDEHSLEVWMKLLKEELNNEKSTLE